MITTFLSTEISKLLVIVPNNNLRKQIGEKFITLGILRNLGIVNENVKNPIVGILKKGFKTKEDEQEFFNTANVVITTMQLAITLEKNVINKYFSHLFIDEAHHITANRWGAISDNFNNQIVQFTATPFRNDGRVMKGNIIYKYSLVQAQEEMYFKKIDFKYVREFDEKKADEEIAKKMVEVLKKDISDGYLHIAMARVNTINRAEEVLKIYSNLAPEMNPATIHYNMNNTLKEIKLNDIFNGKCKIIVCVDMLGEGFDFPQLKVAAIHDAHKTIAPTIQFIGRFTRTSSQKIGDASVIANIADDYTNKVLEELYSQDADWNKIIRETSDVLIDKELKKIKFLNEFKGELPEYVPLQNIFPALSMYTFKTKYANFLIDKAIENIENENIITSANYEENILVCIEKTTGKTDWCSNTDIIETNFDLYIIYFDKANKIIYVGTTTKNPPNNILSNCFEDAQIINGEAVFKSLHNIKRLKLSTLGLNANNNGYVSYRMYAGRDVIEGISDPHKLNSSKNNLFAKGYENQEETSIGCSKKGKIWTKKIGNMLEWKEWCDLVGKKIIDSNIKVEDIIKDIPVPKILKKLPNKVPISIEFQPDILIDNESRYSIRRNQESVEFTEIDIKLHEQQEQNKISFYLECENWKQEFDMTIKDEEVEYNTNGKHTVEIKAGTSYKVLLDWFMQYPPKITYSDGSTLENNYYLEFGNNVPKYNKEELLTYDWNGVIIRKESQGENKETDSIQYKVISEIGSLGYDIIYDDDGAGEVADIIAIRVNEEYIQVDLYHCKFSSQDKPGARIDDLYVVCGQAQKSINWKTKPNKLIQHMYRRENLRLEKKKSSRFEFGNVDILKTIEKKEKLFPVKMNVYIVQPGVSKSLISDTQLNLLGVTESWLMETLGVKLNVIVND